MRVIRRVLRTLWILMWILIAFAVGTIGVLTLTEKGRQNLAGIVSDRISSPGQSIRVGGISGITLIRLMRTSSATSARAR